VKDADVRQYLQLFPGLQAFQAEVAASMREELSKAPSSNAGERERARLTNRQKNAAVTLYRMSECESLWTLLRFAADPSLRSSLVHAPRPLGADPAPLLDRWNREPDVSALRALTLCLGEFAIERLPSGARERLVPELLRTYREDPDPGVHSAVEWLLRRW